jgi:hypothetical protein
VLHFLAKQEDVKNSLTEKCENCMMRESSMLTRTSNVEHADSTASTGSSSRQSSRYFGIGPALKSNARNSASSSTRSGGETTETHWRSRCADSQSAALISLSVRSYVPYSVLGNTSSACRIRSGGQLLRYSSWQYTHLNLPQKRA